MTAGHMIAMINDTERRSPGFLFVRVRDTWARRYVPIEWYDETVAALRMALAKLPPDSTP